MEHTTCDGCRYYRKGRCTDWTVQALLGGVPLTDGLARMCWESEETESDEDAESVEGDVLWRF